MLRRICTPSATHHDVNTVTRCVSSAAPPTLHRPSHSSRQSTPPPPGYKPHHQQRYLSSNASSPIKEDDPTSQSSTASSTSPNPPPEHPPFSLPRPDPSASHTTLETFLHYAQRSRLSPKSATYRGTLYEYVTQTHLEKTLSFNLTRVGGKNDTGIDLQGTWNLPALLSPCLQPLDHSPQALQTLIQCKRLTRTAGPTLIRELEGTTRHGPVGWRGDHVLGIVACTRPATKGIRDAMGRSARGMVWMMLEEVETETEKEPAVQAQNGGTTTNIGNEDEDQDENQDEVEFQQTKQSSNLTLKYHVPQVRLRQFLYNAAAASRCGLEGVHVGMKYDENGDQAGVQLLWQGKPIHSQNL